MATLSPLDRKSLAERGYAVLTPDERWRWHAYDRAWRQLFGFPLPSPADPDLDWQSTELDYAARGVLAKEWPKLARQRRLIEAPILTKEQLMKAREKERELNAA